MSLAWEEVADLGNIRIAIQDIYGGTQRLRLHQALDRTWRFQATDLRDNIYSLLSLCDFPVEPIIPDYKKTVLQVNIDAARVFLADANFLDPLSRSQLIYSTDDANKHWKYSEPEEIPSWLPQIVETQGPSPQFSLYNASAHRWMNFRACLTNDIKVLRLEGVKCDSVKAITSYPQCLGDDRTFRRWQAENESILNQGSPAEVCKSILRIRYKLQRCFLTGNHHPSNGELQDMSTCLLILESRKNQMKRRTLKITRIYEVLRRILSLSTIQSNSKHGFRGRMTTLVRSWHAILNSTQSCRPCDGFLRCLFQDTEVDEPLRLTAEQFALYRDTFAT